MKRRSGEINIFSMSALDLFASALGAFILIAIVLFPYFPNIGASPEDVAALHAQLNETRQQLNESREQLQASQSALAQARQEAEELKQELAKAKFPHLDLVIALDTTGSMREPIDGLKQELGEMVQVLSRLAPSLGVGVVAFNDRRQTPVVSVEQLREVSPGSANFNRLKNFINRLSAGSASGENNDTPEAVYRAFRESAAMSWRGTAEKKIIVVITDAPPYNDEYRAIIDAARDFASASGQSVSGVWIGTDTTTAKFLEDLSKNGRGRFVRAGGSVTSSILLALLDT